MHGLGLVVVGIAGVSGGTKSWRSVVIGMTGGSGGRHTCGDGGSNDGGWKETCWWS